MKHLKDYVIESEEKDVQTTIVEESSDDQVFVVYFGDGTMYNYYTDIKEAEAQRDALNKEVPDNKAEVKKEPMSNIKKD